MKRTRHSIWAGFRCGIVTLLCLVSFDAAGLEFIRIASFNIAEFGEGRHADTRDLDAIADMLVDHDLDLIAIQEVGVAEKADRQVAKLTDLMNRRVGALPSVFSYCITPRSGDERCAVIYKTPVVLLDGEQWLEPDKKPGSPELGGATFFRIPPVLSFQANNFDFKLVIVHLTWGNLLRRQKEMAFLKNFLRGKTNAEGEKDWIVIGDMNRYGKYSASTPGKPFDQFFEGQWISHYRFPLLEAITEPDRMTVFSAPRDEYSTTVAQSRNLYDQIIISQGAYREFGTEKPQFNIHVGIIAFDMKPPFAAITDHTTLKYTLSDHRRRR